MAFDFYFAGTQCMESEYLIRDLDANVLKSYINDRKELQRWFEYKKNGWKGKLLIDSGAFTIHRKGGSVNMDEYIDWLNDNDEYIDYAIELDDIPGTWGQPRTAEELAASPEKSWQNYIYMIGKMKSPNKLMPVFHQGEHFKWLENMLDCKNLEYICISGNKELTNKQREDWYDRCYYYISRKRPELKVHCLGSATIQNAERFPFTSMDATSWIMTGANGGILTDYGVVYVGDGGKTLAREFRGKADIISKYLQKYDLTLEQVGSDYKARMLANVHWLYDKSLTAESKKASYNRRFLL